ncbi:MAG: glycosyltransferase family 2 protein [Bacteroidia bacterium]|nr:glycosyltransferase family 2 protein [Bacteroidia bacterium]
MAVPAVTLVILNWNGRALLERFLPSVLASGYPDFRVLVVDNGSTDDSLNWLAAHLPAVQTLALDQNYGFAEGNNRALPLIDTPYFALINSDAEVTPGWLDPMIRRMEAHPEIAVVQPKLRDWELRGRFEYAGASGGFIDALGYPFCRGRMFDTVEQDEGQYDTAMPIFWATGACCVIRTEVVREHGLFDPAFFAHMEEIDFCWRVQNAGYQVWVEPASVAYHVGGATLPQGSPRKTYLNARNSLACLYKNLPAGQLLPKLLLRLLLDGVWGLRFLLQRQPAMVGALLRAHRDFYLSTGRLRRERRRMQMQRVRQMPAAGRLRGSAVWAYFIQRKHRWSDLFPAG